MKIKTNYRWVIKIVAISVVASMIFTLVSSEILGNVGYITAFAVLAVFILLGILFDIIGVAVTAASPAPFHSMAAHREKGAREALRLLKNAEKVSSFCNDVVGDVSGIVSGSTASLVVARLVADTDGEDLIPQLVMAGLVSGLMIGGKAIGKTIALNNSTGIVLQAGKLISLTSRRNSHK